MTSPTPPAETGPKTMTFLGHSLRPLRKGEVIELSIMATLFGLLFSWLLPNAMPPASLANAFLMACFMRAGMRLNVSGIAFLLFLSFVGADFFRFVQAALTGG